VKMGEMEPEEAEFSEDVDQMGVATPAGAWAEFWSTTVELLMGSAEGESGDVSATIATKPAINSAASGGRT
jgi:hypothetical protein